jgi:RNA polymerase sigma factor (sigma-70 family)
MRDPSASDTRSSLLTRLRVQDEHAWREFFRIYTPIVLGYIHRKGLQPDDAEDVCQEVLLEVAKCIQKFQYKPEMGRFRDWLGTIVHRKVIRYWKARGYNVNKAPQLDTEDGQLDAEWFDEFRVTIMRTAIENIRPRITEQTWLAFETTWVRNESALAAAERLQIPIEVVYNAKYRVLKLLEAEVIRISDDCAWPPTLCR